MESCTTPYSTLLYDIRIQVTQNTPLHGCPPAKLSSPACLFAARTATHPPTCLVHCYLASRVYNDQTIFIITQNTQDLIEGNNNLYNIYGLFDLLGSGGAVFSSVYFICLTREHLFIVQTNKTQGNTCLWVLNYWGKQTSLQTLSHCCFSELYPLVLQFPSVKAVLLSLETFPFVLGPGGSIYVPGRKVQKVWIVKNGKYCTTPYFTLLWYTQVTKNNQEYSYMNRYGCPPAEALLTCLPVYCQDCNTPTNLPSTLLPC